jgi:hypothetical protein
VLTDTRADPVPTFTVETCCWFGGFELMTLRCRHGADVYGLVARGSHRSERRDLIRYLRGRHGREHGCCGCAG